MVRRILAVTICTLALTAVEAWSVERFALVIGNGGYTDIDPLANPPNDARLVSETLESVGFKVTTLIDADKRTMDDATRKFAEQLDQAGREAVGVFYFAGHGVSYEGENWLIPVRAPIKQGVDIEYETVSANKVLKLMERARNATDILILDACRNSPFRGFSLSGTRAVSRGMGRMDAPAGSFIAYSTAPGAVAYDGSGDYSPFAEAFAAEARASRKSIGDMMIEVRKKVKAATKGLGATPQTPWDASSLTGHFSFNPGPAAEPQSAGTTVPTPQPQVTAPRTGPTADQRLWATVENSQDPAEYAAYLNKYPDGEFAAIARARQQRYGASASTGSSAASASGAGSAMPMPPGGGPGNAGSGADPDAVAFCREFASPDSYADCLAEYAEDEDDWGGPADTGGWDTPADYPATMPGAQPTTMVWYDDDFNQWQVNSSAMGFTASAQIAGFGQMVLRGQTEGYVLTYTIHDAAGQQIGYGQGTVMDPTHIAATSYYPDGTVMGIGRFHINHMPK